MKQFGLTDSDFKILSTLLFTPMVAKGAEVYVFGSRARGDHQKFSDIDILYKSSVDIEREVAQIREHLEESNITIKVDLVKWENLAESYKAKAYSECVRI